MKTIATRLYRGLLLKAQFCAEASTKFPRITKEQIEANWRLATNLVTPSGKTQLNGARAGGKSSFNSTLKAGPIPKNHHVTVAKEISKAETVFIEEGEFRGVLFKIITGSPELAAAARGTLTSTQAFDSGITVLLCDKTDLKGAAYYDKQKKLLVSNGVSDTLLQSVINDQ
jgi:hypothetical protein